MNKVKLLSVFCVGLLITNIGLVWFLLSHKPGRQKGGGPKKMVIEKLDFDENQVKAYTKLIDWHKSEVIASEQKITELKNKLYSTLATENELNIKDSLIIEIGTLQMALEKIHYKHFQDIKQLCKPEQKKAFEAFSIEITHLFPRTGNKPH
jgi:periplasmic protein CpxP/Spy